MSRLLCLSRVFFLATALAACVSTPAEWLRTYDLPTDPRPGSLVVCTAFACAGTAPVSLDSAEWGRVRTLFTPRPADAQAERQAAARAVGLLEELVGAKAGTAGDRARDDVGGEDSGQLDCIAETANTTLYLLLMERDGLLAFHRVATPESRGFLIFSPHCTAVLEEKDNGQAYVVDSWFGSNGEAARVGPLAAWRIWDVDGDAPEGLLARRDEVPGREGP